MGDGAASEATGGTDPTLRNQKKLTALDFAHTSDRPEVTELIAGALRKRLPKGSW